MVETERRSFTALAAAAAMLCFALLSACGTVDRIRGKDAASGAEAAKPEDPLARPIQVGLTSARASYCGFLFDPAKLRADFLAAEARAGTPPDQMPKIEHAYDYTHDSILDSIKDDPGYCNKPRTEMIRRDLNRYLAGDYAPPAPKLP
jgi:hypothetical protein